MQQRPVCGFLQVLLSKDHPLYHVLDTCKHQVEEAQGLIEEYYHYQHVA